MIDQSSARTDLIAYLALNAPAQAIGRTALMKYCYFLQELRSVPLGYSFSLYSYGPFDSTVLHSLGQAEALGLVTETPTPAGYGYRIARAVSKERLEARSSQILEKHCADVDWVLQQFGSSSTSDLELDSTIVYIDRETARAGSMLSEVELAQRVHEVKPRFSYSTIKEHIEALKTNKDLLTAVSAEPARTSRCGG